MTMSVFAYPSGRVSKACVCGHSFGFESHRVLGCLSDVTVVWCKVDVYATGWSFVQSSPTACGVSFCARMSSWPALGCSATEKSLYLYLITRHANRVYVTPYCVGSSLNCPALSCLLSPLQYHFQKKNVLFLKCVIWFSLTFGWSFFNLNNNSATYRSFTVFFM